MVLRIEDIDTTRCRAEFVTAIHDDLAWLGVLGDEFVVQSEQAVAHGSALDRLRTMGLLYACTCTRAEIALSAPHGAASVYPGTCREASRSSDGAAWRLDVWAALRRTGPLSWHDADVGIVAADPLAGGDVVLARKGHGIAYHLAMLVDDAASGVTHVVRGSDLFAATHVQRLLQALLDLPTPTYRHHALIGDAHGSRLAKRTPGATLADLRAAGTDPVKLATDLRAGVLPLGFTWVAP